MTQAPETPGVVIGNHTAKYTAKNPAIKWLTERFVTRLDAMIGDISRDTMPATNPLEVGAGAGAISQKRHGSLVTAVGLALPDAGLREEWRTRPGPHYLHGDAENLPFVDKQFDLVVCVEGVAHLRDPEA